MTSTLTTTMTIFDQISLRIIKEQELVIGPVAWDEARKVQGFKVLDQSKDEVAIEGDPAEVLNKLVAQYSRLFGQVSKEVCKQAVQDLIAELPQDQVPDSLQ